MKFQKLFNYLPTFYNSILDFCIFRTILPNSSKFCHFFPPHSILKILISCYHGFLSTLQSSDSSAVAVVKDDVQQCQRRLIST